MEELNNLIKEEKHESIAEFEEPELKEYKTIALIFLERYEEAKKYVNKNTFEEAYIYFKLKSYKKCVKILNKIVNKEEKHYVLLSQALYYLGYYNTAHLILSKLKVDDEIAINLSAMKSLAIVANVSSKKLPGKFSLREKDTFIKDFKGCENYKFKNQENFAEFKFNQTFEKLGNKSEFIKSLTEINDTIKHSLIENQLKNVKGEFEEINKKELTTRQLETVEFNEGKIDKLKTPQLFQFNFISMTEDETIKHKFNSEYSYFSYARTHKFFNSCLRNIPNNTDNMKLLIAYVLMCNKKYKSAIKSLNKVNVGHLEKEILFLSGFWKDKNEKQQVLLEILGSIEN